MSSRAGGDASSRKDDTTNNLTLQELAIAGASAVESFGPEPGGPLVRVDIARHGSPTLTFTLRCGLVVRGGAS